jgi:hypothetical protein
MNPNPEDLINAATYAEKMKFAQAQQAQCGQAIGGVTQAWHRPSLREEAEKSVGYHREQADKQDRAAAFFREHPEFDEFIQLIRSGTIGI